MNMIGWKTWQEFRAAQQEIILSAHTAAHIPVTIRFIDSGQAQRGTVLLMHGIPTWGYLYHAVIPPLVQSGFRVLAPDFLGHGWSDRRDRFDRSFQDQARYGSSCELEGRSHYVWLLVPTSIISSERIPPESG